MAWKLASERVVSELICAPGNPGIAKVARCLPIDSGDPDALLALAQREAVNLTVVGPELPLARGARDLFAAHDQLLFGPTREAARLEWSKAFAKQFMARHRVPTARCRICDSPGEALEPLARGELGFPVVIKADGLAAGKGVTVAPESTECGTGRARCDGGAAVWRCGRPARDRGARRRRRSFVSRHLRRSYGASAAFGAGPQARI